MTEVTNNATIDARYVRHNGENIPVEANLTLEEIKAAMAQLFPEVRNATPIEENGVIRFFVEAGEKGTDARFVRHNGENIPVELGLSLEEIKAAMAQLFPEVRNATPIEENGVIRFFVEAGEKGTSA